MATRTTNDVAQRLRDWRSIHLTKVGALCDDAAAEIERLQKVIDDYVYVAQASAKEIRHLRLENAMTDRDTFAAAALTGLLADGEWPEDSFRAAAEEAYAHADAMLRERGVTEKEKLAEVSVTLTDAERSAIADAADRYAEITPESADTAATLRGLLERSSPDSMLKAGANGGSILKGERHGKAVGVERKRRKRGLGGHC